MNYFQAQDGARRKTWQLALLFGAAVVTLVVLTNLLVLVAVGWFGTQTGQSFEQLVANTPADSWLWITLGVVGTIGVASGYKFLSLRGGGRTIAESLGGRLIPQSTTNAQQRQLLNVVEEMAIASGTAVPPVYLIPEASINAFAAGFSSDDAVIGINQGTLDTLNREELQGVVAHEFSHILNGDTKINLRLIAILHGILFIGMIGYGLLRIGGAGRSRNGMPVLVIGLGLLVVGYGGVFFGNLIKAAVSRQREYLADAAAVQFTRNPSGIANALKKIGGFPASSHLVNSAAEQASHMFFGAAAKRFASSVFATHPPLEKRIRAIEPRWDGAFPTLGGRETTGVVNSAAAATSAFAAAPPAGLAADAGTVEQLVEQVGAPTAESLTAARALIASSPDILREAAHDPYEARALVYNMLLDGSETVRGQQLAHLQQHAEAGVLPHLERLGPAVAASDSEHLLTLLDMAMPALKELSNRQYRGFMNNAAELITADGHVAVFEWVLHRLLVKELKGHFEAPAYAHGNVRHVSRRGEDAAKLLAILASLGSNRLEDQLSAYHAGLSELELDVPFAPQEVFDYRRMNRALGRLRELRPLAKPALLKACARTIMAAGGATATQRGLLRGIAATLDCPVPPVASG